MAPQLLSGCGIEGLHLIAFRRGDQDAPFGLAPVERLRIEVARKLGPEARLNVNGTHPLGGEAWHDVTSIAVWRAMVGQDCVDCTSLTHRREYERSDERNSEHEAGY